ncbi:glycoside hydrolase family protein [Sphingobacterium hungaricum]
MSSSRRDFIKLFSAGIGVSMIDPKSVCIPMPEKFNLLERMLPAPKNGGFAMDDYWVWDPSVIKGEDGLYHMFASRWSKDYGFGNWVTNSQIVRAVSKTPAGPYEFAEVVLPARGNAFFDGYATHNARIVKSGEYYVLYYFGARHDEVPTPEQDVWATGLAQKYWMNKRVGMAWSKSIYGPWERSEKPIIEPRPGKWDTSITSNPSPVVLPDGKVYLMYKSSPKNYDPPLMLGAAMAKSFKEPYERLSDEPLFQFHSDGQMDNDVEDPFVWYNKDHYELIMKDRFGHICGEEGGGIHGTSKDGITWDLSKAKAYSKTILWDDGSTTVQANFERPFLLFENGKATHFFAATGSGSRPYEFDRTWNMVIPLK